MYLYDILTGPGDCQTSVTFWGKTIFMICFIHLWVSIGKQYCCRFLAFSYFAISN